MNDVLLVEPDQDTRELIAELLSNEGFRVHSVASLELALRALDEFPVNLALVDLRSRRDNDIADLQSFVKKAHPTPVGVLSGWLLTTDEATRLGVAFVQRKPFEVEHLLERIASWTSEEVDTHVDVEGMLVRRYFEALSRKDWDALLALCTETVEYILPGGGRFARTIVGAIPFRTYTEQTFRHFADAQFNDVKIHRLPNGLTARYVSRWSSPDAGECTMAGAVSFRFQKSRVCKIGVKLDNTRLDALLASAG